MASFVRRTSHLASQQVKCDKVGPQGGSHDGVEVISTRNGTAFRLGPPLSGNSAFSKEPTTNEIMRDLERDFEHVQRKLKETRNG